MERDAVRAVTGGPLGIVLDGVLGGASIFEVSRDDLKKRSDFTSYQALTIELDDRKDF